MRVLHITTDDAGGAGLCCLRIHKALLDMGVESKVVTLRNQQHAIGEYSFGFIKNLISKIPSIVFRMMGLIVTEKNEVRRLCIETGGAYSLPRSSVNLLSCKWVRWADIIHLHWVNNYLDYSSFLCGIDKPVIWTLHDENFFYGIAHYSDFLLPEHPLEKKYAQIKRETLFHVKRLGVVLLSEYFWKKFRDHELLQGCEVRIINNPIDTNSFKPIDRQSARLKLGLPQDDILIGFIAAPITVERKGLEVLSQVIESMGNPKLKILAIGGNPNNYARPNVISVGMMRGAEAISEALSAANYFAMPSHQEAFAQSPMEAMACGLPVVVFPVSGTSELVNERNGIVCDNFTPEALRRGIETLMNRHYDPVEIRKDMISRFSPGAIAHKYIDLYRVLSNN